MAAWLKPLALALLAALLLHIVGMIGIGSQMQSSSALAKKNDPLFTRTIEAASAQEVKPEPPPELPPPPAPRSPRAPSAALVTVPTVTMTITETVAEATATSPTEPPDTSESALTAPTTSVALTAPTETNTDTTAAATPSQTLSAQPSGSTDILLITGNWPADTRVGYKLTGYFQGELFGSGEVQWTRQGDNNERYQVRVSIDAGLYALRMTSVGRISPTGLLPDAFEEYSKRVLAKERIRPLTFEADALILENKQRIARPAAQPMAVQDAVSQFLDIGHRFTEGRVKLQEGEIVRIWLGRPGGLDEWTYDIGAAETMTLPRIGPVTVHELKPRPLANPRGKITMSMWLAPSLQYLPAKIRIQLNDDAYAEIIAEQFQQR